jgi:hypothetical protein
MISPSHPRFASKNKNDAFQCAMVMYASLRIRLDCDRSCPDFLRSNARVIDRSLTKHTWRLRSIRIKLVSFDHAYAVVLPTIRMFMMIVTHDLLPGADQKGSDTEPHARPVSIFRQDIASNDNDGSSCEESSRATP